MTPTPQVTPKQVPSSITAPATAAGITGLLRKAANPTVLLNAVAPFAAYQALTTHGVSKVAALSVASVFPLAAVITAAVRTRRLDGIGMLSMASLTFGIFSALVLHDPHVLLVKDSFISAGLGLAFLGSLLAPRPLTLIFARQLRSIRTTQDLDQQWLHSAGFRARMRQMTVVWGLAMIGEATLRVVLSFLIPAGALLAISPLLAATVFGLLIAWTSYRRRHTTIIENE
jgi:hypothetical protein